jgi:putative RNA 2'-phosphotransferase
MHRKEVQRLAKSLFYVLGVRPDEFGLLPDESGYVTLKQILQALHEEPEWSFVGRGHLTEVLHSPDRQRFEIDEDRIRAMNPAISFVPEPVGSPPSRLFIAVRRRAHPVVVSHGLRPAKGPWVVLSITRDLALRIGKRRDVDPVTLEVKATEASRAGVRFYGTQGLLILAQNIPPEYLLGPPVAFEEERPRPPKVGIKEVVEPPGSFFWDPQRQARSGKSPESKGKDPQWRQERRRREKKGQSRWRG